jgi:hypothetical protein
MCWRERKRERKERMESNSMYIREKCRLLSSELDEHEIFSHDEELERKGVLVDWKLCLQNLEKSKARRDLEALKVEINAEHEAATVKSAPPKKFTFQELLRLKDTRTDLLVPVDFYEVVFQAILSNPYSYVYNYPDDTMVVRKQMVVLEPVDLDDAYERVKRQDLVDFLRRRFKEDEIGRTYPAPNTINMSMVTQGVYISMTFAAISKATLESLSGGVTSI